MKLSAAIVIAAAFLAFGVTSRAATSDDEAQIKTLEDSFVAAVNTKDVDAIMKVYVPDASLVVFDVVPPRQYVGADAYRKDWQDFFAMFNGPVKFRISDLNIEAAGSLGYGHSTEHVSGTDMATDRAGCAGHRWLPQSRWQVADCA